MNLVTASGCSICGTRTRVHGAGYVYRPHLTWCRHARPTVARPCRDPYVVPGTACFICGGLTRGGQWCAPCRHTVIHNLAKETSCPT